MRQRKVLITGASGQLGTALQSMQRVDWDLHAFPSASLDVTRWQNVRDIVASVGPDLVIHCAAATNVDRCEREPAWAYAVNALGARNVAQAVARVNADLVYVSTNYVFDGQKQEPYHEFDSPAPISVYGHTKLAGESESRTATKQCFVVRTASVFAVGDGNFVATLRRLKDAHVTITVVDDQYSNPTFTDDLAEAIGRLTDVASYGTYHVTNSGEASWHEWATEIQQQTGAQCAVMPIPASEYARDAQPPANGTMTSLALPGLDITLPDWRDALQRCLHKWPV